MSYVYPIDFLRYCIWGKIPALNVETRNVPAEASNSLRYHRICLDIDFSHLVWLNNTTCSDRLERNCVDDLRLIYEGKDIYCSQAYTN